MRLLCFLLADKIPLYLQITLPYETQQLSKATRDTAAIYLACGIDISKVKKKKKLDVVRSDLGPYVLLNLRGIFFILWMQASVFVQSHVRAHVELMWLLSSTTPIGWLNRMIQFKEKSRKAVCLPFQLFVCSIIYDKKYLWRLI